MEALVNLVEENQASSEVTQIYEDIKNRYKINFVPNLMRAWANNPEALKSNWERFKHHEDVLGMELAHAVGLSIAAQNLCNYCLSFHELILEQLGWDISKIENLISWTGQNVGGNIYANGLSLPVENQTVQMLKRAA